MHEGVVARRKNQPFRQELMERGIMRTFGERNVGEITVVSWIPDPGLSYEEWEWAMLSIFEIHNSVHWFIGDGLNFGEFKWGETYAQISTYTAIPTSLLRDYKWVSNKVPIEVRRPELEWTHHRIVSSMTLDEMDYWLQAAVDGRWTTTELRYEIRLVRGSDDSAPLIEGSALDVPDYIREKNSLMSELSALCQMNYADDLVEEWVSLLRPPELEIMASGQVRMWLRRMRRAHTRAKEIINATG